MSLVLQSLAHHLFPAYPNREAVPLRAAPGAETQCGWWWPHPAATGVNPAVPIKAGTVLVTWATRHGCYPHVWVCMDLARMCSAIPVPRHAEGDAPGSPRSQGSELTESSSYPQAGPRNLG